MCKGKGVIYLTEEIDLSYEDLCTECEFHDKCHKNGIDYDEIDKCNGGTSIQLDKDDFERFKRKDPEPKEKVEFT
jgi:hypothetical protein